MSLAVSKDSEGQYIAEMFKPESTWVEILAGKLMCDDVTISCLAISQGLLVLMEKFGKPAGPEDVT